MVQKNKSENHLGMGSNLQRHSVTSNNVLILFSKMNSFDIGLLKDTWITAGCVFTVSHMSCR